MVEKMFPVRLSDEDQKHIANIQKYLKKERGGKITQADAIRYALRQALSREAPKKEVR